MALASLSNSSTTSEPAADDTSRSEPEQPPPTRQTIRPAPRRLEGNLTYNWTGMPWRLLLSIFRNLSQGQYRTELEDRSIFWA